ncbi:hypothetical protein ACN20G_29965 (plasmid) [Streptomyces sp. BI20]|uniref:hypothetical protein n=1 Tax=Streptomyces sp. BI20 TaxID=3403460 RepID=UPI003C7828CC
MTKTPIEFYYLPACPPCERTKPEALKAAEATGVDIVFINAKTRDKEALTAKGVTVAPTINNGKRLIKGEQSYDRLVRFFAE